MAFTLDELLAAGLDEAQAKAILETQGSGNSSTRLFAETFKVSYDEDSGVAKGNFQLGGKKNKSGEWDESPIDLGKSVEIILVGTRGQYTAFDAVSNRSTVSSNIFASSDAKNAYDLKSGKSIAELKASGITLTYNTIAAILVKTENGLVPAAYYIKGTSLNSFIESTKGLKNGGNINYTFTLTTEKQKKGTTVYYVVKFAPKPLDDLTVLKNMKQVAELSKEYNDFVHGINNSGSKPATKVESKASKQADDEDLENW